MYLYFIIYYQPQDSHCGPLFFNLFVNHIKHSILNTEFLLFTNDLKCYKKIENASDMEVLQKGIDTIYQ